MHIITYSHG